MNDIGTPTSFIIWVSVNSNLDIEIYVAGWAVLFVLVVAMIALAFRLWSRRPLQRFHIDQAELGVGNQKIILRPDVEDLQIAYKIWVDLSTRKIGLPIDLEHDVLTEIYDSWYQFFSVTREYIKDVPVTRFRRSDTEHIIRLSIDVLNLGVRPHLTKWQARFRRWYEQQLSSPENLTEDPQSIQARFPQYDELVKDLHAVNQRLITYRDKLYDLISGK